MTIECYFSRCPHHGVHRWPDDGPFCYEEICHPEPTFEQWLEANEDELICKAAETGADREADFDSDRFAEREYNLYMRRDTR